MVNAPGLPSVVSCQPILPPKKVTPPQWSVNVKSKNRLMVNDLDGWLWWNGCLPIAGQTHELAAAISQRSGLVKTKICRKRPPRT